MTATERMRDYAWTSAECHVIAEEAYARWIDVEPWSVHLYLEVWRQWYYGMISTDAVLRLPGVRQLPVSGR